MKKTSHSNKLARREPLSRERIFTAALELADQGGMAAVSMRQIAQRLNVEAMSLYKHIANKEDLMDGLVELVFAQMTVPAPELEWRAALRERAYTTRQVLNKYPWAASLIETRAALGPTRLRHHNNMIGILRRSGFSIGHAYNALIALTSYVYGFVIMEQAWFTPPAEQKSRPAAEAPPISAEEFPYIHEMIRFVSGRGGDQTVRPQPGLADEFEFGLNTLLDGFGENLPK